MCIQPQRRIVREYDRDNRLKMTKSIDIGIDAKIQVYLQTRKQKL